MRTYKYRIYPTAEQERTLREILYVSRTLYNLALQHRRDMYARSRRTVTLYDQSKLLTLWRNEGPKEENLLQLLSVDTARDALRRLDRSYREFLKGKRGFPRFKGSRHYRSFGCSYGQGASIKDNTLRIGATLIEVRWHRGLPNGSIKHITVINRPSGWYVCFQIEIEIEPRISEQPPVGIDMGIHHALALSDGTIIDSPKVLQQSLRKLRVLQRTVARRRKGSNRRRKAVHQVARLQEHIANQRRHFWHEVITWLVSHYGLIALEDLSLGFMLKNGNLSRAAHDVGLGIFQELLDYKAIEAGVRIVNVKAAYTSQICSACGCFVEKELSVRTHICPECGYEADRDVNAALNILHRAEPALQELT